MTRPKSSPNSLAWLWLIVGAAVLTQTSINLLRPVTSYKLLSMGFGETAIGLATAVYALLPLFMAMPFGRLTSKVGSLRGLMTAGGVLIGLGGAILALAGQAWLIMVGSAVLGVGHLMFTIAGQSMISRRSPAHQMDAAFGWFTAAFSVGQMTGPLLSGLLLGNVSLAVAQSSGAGLGQSITLALWIGAAAAVLSAPVLFVLRPLPDPTTSQLRQVPPAGAEKPTMLSIVRRPGVASNMLASLALLAIVDILIAFLPLVGEAAGVSPLAVGVLLALRGAASVVSRIFLPMLVRRYRRSHLVLVSLFVSALAIAMVPFTLQLEGAFWAAGVLISLGGLTLGLGQPLSMTLISQAVPYAWRSPALALRLMTNRVGQVVLPVAAGVVAGPLGPGGGVWFACAMLAVSGTERLINHRTGPNDENRDADSN